MVTVLWTLLWAVVLYVVFAVIVPITSFVVSAPMISIGRAIKPLKLPMWFLSRYLTLALEIALCVWCTLLIGAHFDVWLPALFIVDAIVFWGIFQTLYQFDQRLFYSQSGPWAADERPTI